MFAILINILISIAAVFSSFVCLHFAVMGVSPWPTTNIHWVFEKVIPSIRRYGYYKLFDNPNNNMFKIETETNLHYKFVQYIRRFYPKTILIAGPGENQNISLKKIDS